MRKLLPLMSLCITILSPAQNTRYFLRCLSQNNDFNPAYIPNLNMHIGLPGISGMNVEACNTRFTYGEPNEFLVNLEQQQTN